MSISLTTPSYRIEQRRRITGTFPGPKSAALEARRAAVVAKGVASSIPVYAADADGGIIVDVDGNAFTDLGSGIAVTSVGASDPAVVAAVQEQVEHFTHTCFMVTPYEGYVAVAERLAAVTPGDFEKRTVLFNSGAEAVENAVKIARSATGRDAVVAFDHAYHGRTNLTMGLTAKAMPYKTGFGPFAPEIYRMPMSYPFREENPNLTGAEAADRAILAIEKQIGADQLAALLIEPIQGEGGFIVPAEGFLPRLAEWAQANGVVFIADEVQSGFCRTGEWFAVQHEGVVPDLITMAKGIAGGLPLSAVTGRAELLDAVHPGGLGGTYGGNPVACAAALAAMDTMVSQDLAGRARHIEELVRPRLEALVVEGGVVGDVRGRGAMLAMEFVRPGSRTPDAEAAKAVAAACLQEGVIVLTCGTYGNVIRLLPPLTIGDELLLDALEVLETAVRARS
ncbi:MULTISPECIES: 4-aminobutyrate--2-oxoglutarate transaminase [unclassified Arthrobacter]|uniref:4-aminobutyrate--2-oxoglutarate transaminase n=1 Tax=unclassified Arthrobacter TaxID=235627 RepID=UPI001D15111E|nr:MULTISPECIES: 4-aminobutyrate--2-oxoglutarate transaminase [unclassified Arthrobacter]MCC3290165.1 4-aminobutyrate--2-oxoglutarate transaminase [Arthrobacter sp. zg-Y1110]MCC3300324.1 4-aminobutyrate--2-oxoglutarate transaminase [Arthrobacter sp. zg-Y895]UWX84447.1 4-aminobutyrate--2-oxoglutarate transaminase [Arthrobacter sp. zg-Y1110]